MIDFGDTEIIDPGWEWDDKYSFNQAVRTGPYVFITGQVGMDEQGNIVGPDMTAQAERTFVNIDQILQQAGGSIKDIIQMRAYVTDFTQYGDYEKVRARMTKGAKFASTAVQVSSLIFKELVLEIDGIAYLRS